MGKEGREGKVWRGFMGFWRVLEGLERDFEGMEVEMLSSRDVLGVFGWV